MAHDSTDPGRTTASPPFWDRSKERSWLRARRFAVLLRDDPRRVAETADWIKQRWSADPSAQRALAAWRRLLACEPAEVEAKLLARDDAGEFLRDTLPPAFPIPASERAALTLLPE